MAVPKVTVIVPTLAEAHRRTGLFRALDSLRSSSSSPIRILTVVNGTRFDPEVVRLLHCMNDVEVVQTRKGSLAGAIAIGRSKVSTPFFGFLDDDDEYLPGAIDRRLTAIEQHQGIALVVTNGYRQVGESVGIALESVSMVQNDPLRSLMNYNWLASCGGLFRTQLVGTKYFQNINPYTEWTWLAFRISHDHLKVVGVDEATFRINDSEGSASKSEAYRRAFLDLYQRMMSYDLPADVSRKVCWSIADAHHDLSDFERQQRNFGLAWRHHLNSISSVYGLTRYVGYTWRLLKGW